MLEVESLVGDAVESLVSDSPAYRPHRDVLVSKIIEALEINAAWVDLFGVTGELDVPGEGEGGELKVPLQKVKDVGCSL